MAQIYETDLWRMLFWSVDWPNLLFLMYDFINKFKLSIEWFLQEKNGSSLNPCFTRMYCGTFQRMRFNSYPKIPRVVNMDRHIANINSFDTIDCNVFCLVFIFISWFPEGFCWPICQTANHGWSAWSFNINYAS